MTHALARPPDHAERRTSGRARAGLLAFLVTVLSLGVVFGNPRQASAVDVLTPVQINGALKSPPAQIIRWTPAGRVITLGLGLGMLAYQTRDSWWPGLAEWFNPKDEVEVDPGIIPNAASPSCVHMSTEPPVLTSAGTITLSVTARCTYNYQPTRKPALHFSYSATCRNTTTGGISYPQVQSWDAGGGGSQDYDFNQYRVENVWMQAVTSPPICPAGSLPVDATLSTRVVSNNPDMYVGEITGMLRGWDLFGFNGGYPDSAVDVTTTIECVNPSTLDPVGTVSATSTGQPDRLPGPSCSAEYPGSIPWTGDVTKTTGGGAPETVGSFDTDPDLFEAWRDCFGPTGVICKTEVYVDGQRCVIGRDVCIIWPRINRGEPERVECRFGAHSIGTEYCNPLKQAYGTGTKFDTQTDVEIITNPDWDPEVKPDPTTPPDPNPTTNPTPTPPPTPQPPTPVPNPDPPTEVVPETTEKNCVVDAVSWNPLQWVYVPVKCAIKWAFIPKTSIPVRTTRIKTTFDGKFPFTVPAMIGGMGSGTGGGCPDWNVIVDSDTWSAVCNSSFTAAVRGARGFLFAGMVAAAFWPLVRGLFFASVPIIKPVPTSEK